MIKMLLLLVIIVSFASADTYTLTIDKQPGQGSATLPTTTTIKYQHDGSVVPTSVAFVLDSVQVHATDAGNNVGLPSWLFIKVTPVNDNAPVVVSDTVTVIEGGSHTWGPTVTDADN